MCGFAEYLFWWGKNTVKLSIVEHGNGGVKIVQQDHHVCGVGYGARKRLYQLVATGILVYLSMSIAAGWNEGDCAFSCVWTAVCVAVMALVILMPSLPNLLNCCEISRRRSWHETAFAYDPAHAEPVTEVDYALYNQVHFNGTLQRKFVNYDCLASKERIDKLVALQGDGVVRQPWDPATPLWTIVDGPTTDGSDIKRMLEPNKPLYLSGFSRGAYAAMIAASVLHTLTGIRPLLIVGEPVIGHTALMPRRGLHELVINVLTKLRENADVRAAVSRYPEWLRSDRVEWQPGAKEGHLSSGPNTPHFFIEDVLHHNSDKLTVSMVHPQSCAYYACGEVRRMMDPYLPVGFTSCGRIFSGYHTTLLDPAQENPFVYDLKQSAVGRWLCRLPIVRDGFAMDLDLTRRDTVYPAVYRDVENRKLAYTNRGPDQNIPVPAGVVQEFSADMDLNDLTQPLGLVQLDPSIEVGPKGGRVVGSIRTHRIVSTAGRADDWLLSVGFDVPSCGARLVEHFNNLNASELTKGRLGIINRVVAAHMRHAGSDDQGSGTSQGYTPPKVSNVQDRAEEGALNQV